MNKQTKRTVVLTSVILAIAIVGLIATNALQRGQNGTAAEALGTVLQGATPSQGPAVEAGSPYWAIVKMLSALVIVIAALYGGLYLLRRLMTNRRSASAQAATLEVIESAYVGPKKMVSLVRVGSKAVLVGVTDQQISMLTELGPEETKTLLAGQAKQAPGETFSQLFKRTTDKFREMQVKKDNVIAEA